MNKCFCHLNGLAVKDATARKQIEDINKEVETLDVMREQITQLLTIIDQLNTTIGQLNTTIEQQNTIINQQDIDITNLENVVNNHSTKIENIEVNIDGSAPEVEELKQKVETLNTELNQVKTNLTSLDKRITANDVSIKNNKNQLDNLKTRIDEYDLTLVNHESRIRALENEEEEPSIYPYNLYSTFKNETTDTIIIGGNTIASGYSKSIAVARVNSETSTTPIYLSVTYGFVGGDVYNSLGNRVYYFTSEEFKNECYFAPNETFRFTEEQTAPEPDTPSVIYPYYKYATFINNSNDPWIIGGKTIASIGGSETIAVARVNSATSTTPIYLTVEAGFTGSSIVKSNGTTVYTFTSEEVKEELYFDADETYTIKHPDN